MGLSASQMRYLSLTARQSNLEYEAQNINSERINLANRSSEANKAYVEGMNNKVIRISHWETGTDGRAQKTWKELTFATGLEQGFYVIGAGGNALVPSPYATYDVGQEISAQDYWNLSPEQREAFNFYNESYEIMQDIDFCKAGESITADEWNVLFQGHADKFTESTDADGNKVYIANEDIVWKMSESRIRPDQYQMLLNRGISDDIFYAVGAPLITAKRKISLVNPDYNGMDIQSLLVSGTGQIVTTQFYKFLCDHGYGSGKYYSLNEDGSVAGETTYEKLVEEFQTTASNKGVKTVVDWRADEQSYFKQEMYTEDDAVVLANYEATTAEIQHEDKLLELQLKRIETERNAIQTEMDAVKKVIEKNIENTYKTFG